MQASTPGTCLRHVVDTHYLPLRDRARTARQGTDMVCEHIEEPLRFQFQERFLQILWNEQRFRGELRTLDGRCFEVVSPGTWNVEAGPDFKDATICLDGELRHGAVEIHRRACDWKSHGHDDDALYDRVILHAVWRAAPSATAQGRPPCFEMAGAVQQPWQQLVDEFRGDVYPYARKVTPGRCAVSWALAEDQEVVRLLRIAGLARLGDKALRICRDAVARGFGQALYEAMFGALGYKNNKDAFRGLARAVPLSTLRELSDDGACEAVLFGSAGLLPDPSRVPVVQGRKRRLGELWDAWWRHGARPLDLPWCRSGMRPLNSPERRLAAGCALLQRGALAPDEWLLSLAEHAQSPRDLFLTLQSELRVGGPWAGYQSFTRALRRPVMLLGTSRIRDLIVNVLLPFLHAVGQKHGKAQLVHLAEDTFLIAPRLQGNRILTEAVHRFLVPPSRAAVLLKGACQQQGLYELHRSFCIMLRNDCKNCPFVGTLPVEHADGTE